MKNSKSPKGFLIKLVEEGIKLWLTNQCNSIKGIKIDISGSNFELMRGRLKEVKISAKEILFKSLAIQKIELITSHINFKLIAGKEVFKIIKDFSIKSSLHISSNQLTQIITSNRWNWIRIMIQNELLDSNLIENIKINKNLLEINSYDNNKIKNTDYIKFKTLLGSIILENQVNSNQFNLPMEETIDIENIFFGEDQIIVEFNAKVLKR